MRRARAWQIAALIWVVVPGAPIELLGFDGTQPLPMLAPQKRGRRRPWTLATPVDPEVNIEPAMMESLVDLFATVNLSPAQSEMLRLLLRNEPAFMALLRGTTEAQDGSNV